MHVTRSHAEAPKRSRPQLICGVLWRILYDTVTRSHVVQQEVAERMNDFISQSVGHGESSTIYCGSRGSGSNGFDVACITTDLVEQCLPSPSCRTCGQHAVAWRYLCASDKLSKVVDVRKA